MTFLSYARPAVRRPGHPRRREAAALVAAAALVLGAVATPATAADTAPRSGPPVSHPKPPPPPDPKKDRWIAADDQEDERRGEGRPAVLDPRLRQHRRLVRRQQRRGVRAGNAARDHREVPPRRRPLLRLDAQRGQPEAGRGPVQRHPAGVDVHRREGAAADLHRPGGRPGRPGRSSRPPRPPVRWPSARPATCRAPATSRPSRAPSSPAMGITQNFAPVADVNVNPANPVIGVRSFGSDPDLVAALTAAQVRGLRGRRRHLVHREALPRARRHRDRQPLRVPRSSPTPGRSGRRSTSRRSRPRSTRGSTRS